MAMCGDSEYNAGITTRSVGCRIATPFISHIAWTVMILLVISQSTGAYHTYEKEDMGTLSGDVQNWATLIQNYILQVSFDQ